MNDFFSFLLALLTFDWLKRREQVDATADAFLVSMSHPRPCRDCDDAVYLDITTREVKHASTRQVQGVSPRGKVHDAVAYLQPMDRDDPDNDEMPVIDVRSGPQPVDRRN